MLPFDPDERRRRFPRASTARWVQVRDRFCFGPGCPRPARLCDLDHTHEHGRGGDTVHTNLGPGCWHDHALKTVGGWTLEQPTPGTFCWTSRAGGRYVLPRRPVVAMDLPTPQPRPPSDPVPDGATLATDDGDPTGATSTAWLNDPTPPPVRHERLEVPFGTLDGAPVAHVADAPPPF